MSESLFINVNHHRKSVKNLFFSEIKFIYVVKKKILRAIRVGVYTREYTRKMQMLVYISILNVRTHTSIFHVLIEACTYVSINTQKYIHIVQIFENCLFFLYFS